MHAHRHELHSSQYPLDRASCRGCLPRPLRLSPLNSRQHSPRFDWTLTHRALSPLQVLVAAAAGNYETASSLLSEAQSIIDKNVQRNIIHKNTAARKKSLLTMKVKALEGGAAAAAPVAAE